MTNDQHGDEIQPGTGSDSRDQWRPASDILTASAAERPPRRARWAVVAGVGVLAAALVGGVTYGVGALSGGGTQPESALPSGAFGYLRVDLDPSAGQKIDGFRFMRKFPALKDKLGDRDDLRQVAFQAVAEEAGWQNIDFDADVAPWLGQRIAVAAYPGNAAADGGVPEPGVVAAVAVTDADAARTGLRELTDAAAAKDGGARLGFVVSGDYALLAQTQQDADRAAADAGRGVLADDGVLAADLAAAPDGVVTAWLDTEPLIASLGSLGAIGFLGGMPGAAAGDAGRSTYVARFDGPDVFEVTGTTTGGEVGGWATHPVEGMAELPESSIAALGLADGNALVPLVMDALKKSMDAAMAGGADATGGMDFDQAVFEVEQQLGVELPEDLSVLMGDNLVAAVQGTDTESLAGGVRVRTDADRAEKVLDQLEAATGDVVPVSRSRAGADLVLASSPEFIDQLAATGTLGERPGFSASLPDLATADVATWVDVAAMSRLVVGFAGDVADRDGASSVGANTDPIQGLGVTMSSADDNSGAIRMRLVTR